jgi:hypothetical protein
VLCHIYHCRYAILFCHSNEMLNVNLRYTEHKKEYPFVVYRVYSVSIDNILTIKYNIYCTI